MRYWLMKSEPNVFSIEDLKKSKVSPWDGVRNYQARNYMRDQMKLGDLAFFYHSNANPSGIAGIAKVIREGYPDHTAFDPKNIHYDPKSDLKKPTWFMVDVEFVKAARSLITLERLKEISELKEMLLLRHGRLSVQPVTAKQWKIIKKLPEWR
ncbi:MAG: EVE domain-containing protein [Candidatus Omnitrophica bacterium]|nr:EVE domain-containing protein [Candidatus Omnitrophota bacterium]